MAPRPRSLHPLQGQIRLRPHPLQPSHLAGFEVHPQTLPKCLGDPAEEASAPLPTPSGFPVDKAVSPVKTRGPGPGLAAPVWGVISSPRPAWRLPQGFAWELWDLGKGLPHKTYPVSSPFLKKRSKLTRLKPKRFEGSAKYPAEQTQRLQSSFLRSIQSSNWDELGQTGGPGWPSLRGPQATATTRCCSWPGSLPQPSSRSTMEAVLGSLPHPFYRSLGLGDIEQQFGGTSACSRGGPRGRERFW